MSVREINYVLVVVQWKDDALPLTVVTTGATTEITRWATIGVRKISQKKHHFTRMSLRNYQAPNIFLDNFIQ
jgi:hypothetical protein